MKKSHIALSALVVLIAALLMPILPGLWYIGVITVFGEEDYTFSKQWDDGIQKSYALLAENGYCAHECLDKNSIYFVPQPHGFLIQIYGVADQKLLGQITEIFAQEFSDEPDIKKLIVRAYAFTRGQAGRSPQAKEWSDGAILNVDMKRK